MKKYDLPSRGWMILLFYLCIQPIYAASSFPDTTAFINVTVIPMDSLYTLPDYTVVVGDDRIIAMGPTGTVEIPENTQRVDGQGKYLMPGLADMHVHTFRSGYGFDQDMILFIANGVTTIRHMFGSDAVLEGREQIKAGKLFGPTVYSACPIIDGNPPAWPGSIVPTSPTNARQIVKEQKELGYDFIKVYHNLPKGIYDAIISEAKAQDIPVVGHVPWDVGLEYVLTSGQKSIEHFHGHMAYFGSGYPQLPVWEEIDSIFMNQFIAKTLQSNIWNCPTLTVYKNLITDNEKKLLKALYESGANILLGTDCLNPFNVAGFSIHEELHLYVEAGLTPYDAIKAGTYNAAGFLDALDEFGTVTVGKIADLILVSENPLDDVQNIQDRAGVMVRGKWYTEAQLQDSLQKVENTWNPTDVSVDKFDGKQPSDYSLFQNYPNPFNPMTTIEYRLSRSVHIRLIIYDLVGRYVKTLVDTRQQSGHFKITWNSLDEHNLPVTAGVYFCRMEAGESVKVIKLLLIK